MARRSTTLRKPFRSHLGTRRQTQRIHSLVLQIPRSYNADEKGIRREVEPEKIKQTENEICAFFDGYTVMPCGGWDKETGTMDGQQFRYEMDFQLRADLIGKLLRWRLILERSFAQARIYMKLVGGAKWL